MERSMDKATRSTKEISDDIISDQQKSLLKYLRNPSAVTLSDRVKTIIEIPKLHCLDSPLCCCDHISTEIKVEFMTKLFELCTFDKSDSCTYYSGAVFHLASSMKQVTLLLRQVSPQQYVAANLDSLKWLCVSTDELVQCLIDAQTDLQGVLFGACLRLTAILERSLQDLLWTIDHKTPTVLKDVIQCTTLITVLGNEIIAFLDLIIGPPASLNIRNLVWHGFGSRNEHPESFLLIVYFTFTLIGNKLKQQGVEVSHREFMKIDTSLITSQHPIFLNFAPDNAITELIETLRSKSLEIKQSIAYAQEGKYGLATILLLTSFEHVARVSFCMHNKCPERLMTAISSEYFTTLDHVFEETLMDDTTMNKLYSLLPERLRLALYDLLYYPRGLRLRDKLSHMEVSYLELTKDTWSFCYNTLSSIILYMIYGKCFTDIDDYLVNSYEPLYHPVACVVRVSDKLTEQITLLQNVGAPAGVVVVDRDWTSQIAMCGKMGLYLEEPLGKNQSPLSTSDLLFCSPSRILSTSSGFRPVSEWSRLLHSISENLLAAVMTMHRFSDDRLKMLQDRTLRARQRKNFEAFHSYKEALVIFQTLHSVIVNLIKALKNVDCCCAVQKKHRALLQLSENLCTLVKENKWSNTVEYVTTFTMSHFC